MSKKGLLKSDVENKRPRRKGSKKLVYELKGTYSKKGAPWNVS